jgi:hypothetical protein
MLPLLRATRDMIDELNVFPHNASVGAPLVVGDTVFVSTGNGQDWTHTNIPSPLSPTLTALDRHTGKLLGEEGGEFSSPAAVCSP